MDAKKKNYEIMLKHVKYDLPPKFISNINFNFRVDESLITPEEVQGTYNQTSKLTKDFRTRAMTLYIQSLGREYESLTDEIKRMVNYFPQANVMDSMLNQAMQRLNIIMNYVKNERNLKSKSHFLF